MNTDVDTSLAWKRFFSAWPEEVPARGVVLTKFGEQIPFDGFLISGELLMVNRKMPDSLGARQVILPFSEVSGMKVTDVLKKNALAALGFRSKESLRRPKETKG